MSTIDAPSCPRCGALAATAELHCRVDAQAWERHCLALRCTVCGTTYLSTTATQTGASS